MASEYRTSLGATITDLEEAQLPFSELSETIHTAKAAAKNENDMHCVHALTTLAHENEALLYSIQTAVVHGTSLLVKSQSLEIDAKLFAELYLHFKDAEARNGVRARLQDDLARHSAALRRYRSSLRPIQSRAKALNPVSKEAAKHCTRKQVVSDLVAVESKEVGKRGDGSFEIGQ